MTDRLSIRPATPDDARSLPDIERSAGQAFLTVPGLEFVAGDEVWSVAEHLDWMKKGEVWVAEDQQGKLAGFMIAQVFGDEFHIWEVAVHSEAQGNGLGTAFLARAEQYARDAGLTALTLTTFREIKFNEKFYAKLGFLTLAPGQISVRLSDTLKREAEEGLPPEQRCAMEKRL